MQIGNFDYTIRENYTLFTHLSAPTEVARNGKG